MHRTYILLWILSVCVLLGVATPVVTSAAPTSPYKLPIGAGEIVEVTQGNNGTSHTHGGAWAFDLITSQASFTVVAARPGTVLGVRSDSSVSCDNKLCWTEANYVVVDHGDGTAALYLHLAKGEVYVKRGESVGQGQPLGLSDTTGWADGSHLHFQVEKTPCTTTACMKPGWWLTTSLPVRFSDADVVANAPNGVPQDGKKYRSSNELTPVVSRMDWKNASYKITCDDNAPAGFKVRLKNGSATVSGQTAGSPDYDYFDVQYQASVTGDLDGDGSPETAVLLRCSPQPSNFTVQEVLVLHPDGNLLGKLPGGDSLKAGAILPPQYVPKEFSVRDGNLHAGMLAYGPDDTHASGPTKDQTFVWHWNGSMFKRQR
jgi:murein DD-endopeptidase MepM/ murein hydrolase activator NlpD